MIIELMVKDWKRLHPRAKTGVVMSILKVVFRILLLVGLEALIVYVYQGVDKKIMEYSETASFSLLVFFLGLVGAFGVVNGGLKARKLIYDDGDREIIFPLPIYPSTYLISKVLYVYLSILWGNLLLSVPMFSTYAALRGLEVYYYAGAVAYPFIVSIFYTGLALLVSLLFQLVYLRIKDHDLVQFILASVLMIALCFAYYYFLNLFLSTLQNQSINGVISPAFVEGLSKAMLAFAPSYNLLDMFIIGDYGLENVLLVTGFTLMSIFAGYLVTFLLFKSGRLGTHKPPKEEAEKVPTLKFGFSNLFQKELSVLFKDSSNTFSYTSLLILLPFLTYAVISSFNAIFARNYTILVAYYPELFHIIILALVILFIGSINASSSLSMSNEKGGVMTTKLLPKKLFMMLFAKMLAPATLSFFSYLIAILVLLISGEISSQIFLVSLALGTILIICQSGLGLLLDMKDKGKKKGSRVSVLNNVLSFFLPVLILAMGLPMSFQGIASSNIYLAIIITSLALGAMSFFRIGYRMKKAFYEMEVN